MVVGRTLKPSGVFFAALITLVAFAGCAQSDSSVSKSGAESPPVGILVKVDTQTLYLMRGDEILRQYPISTSKYGLGSQAGSLKTPLGKHRIAQKIGAGAPINTIFKERVNTGRIGAIDRSQKGAPHDDVTTRILWLEGLEPGVNRGRGIDSKERYIYIHGTTSEGLIGRPASNGCVRMYNRDVIDLFDRVIEGTPVRIVA